MEKPNFRFVKGDIADRDVLFNLFKEEKFDIVVNFAAESHVDRSIEDPGIFLKTNVKCNRYTSVDGFIKGVWSKKVSSGINRRSIWGSST